MHSYPMEFGAMLVNQITIVISAAAVHFLLATSFLVLVDQFVPKTCDFVRQAWLY